MARKKLFTTPEELSRAYLGNFSTKRGRKSGLHEARKISLRGRVLSDGKISLYYYSCINGRVSRISAGSFLNVETTPSIKMQNEETIRLAKVKAEEMNVDAEREGHGFLPLARNKILLINYVLKVADDELSETGKKHSYYYNLRALAKHLKAFRNDDLRVSDVDKNFLIEFTRYLRNDASNINYLRADNKEKWRDVSLSENSQHRLFVNLHYVIRRAMKEQIISHDPFSELDAREKPAERAGTREYLTKNELRRLIETPISNDTIKRAFLFSCFTGLRWSDVSSLRWCDLKHDDVGFYADVVMVKTKKKVKAYISDAGREWLTVRSDKTSDEDIIFKLPKNEYVNIVLKKWAAEAKIKKSVSFHVARHTAATMLLNLDVPLEVVAAQLGHGKISTTQIYAKILGRTQKAAIDKQNKLFK